MGGITTRCRRLAVPTRIGRKSFGMETVIVYVLGGTYNKWNKKMDALDGEYLLRGRLFDLDYRTILLCQ